MLVFERGPVLKDILAIRKGEYYYVETVTDAVTTWELAICVAEVNKAKKVSTLVLWEQNGLYRKNDGVPTCITLTKTVDNC